MNTQENWVRVIFDKDETGYGIEMEPAKKGTGALVLISNIPMTNKLNIGDLVEAVPSMRGNLLSVKKIVSRDYKNKTAVLYPEPHRINWEKIIGPLHAAGCKAEGFMPGLLMVAHNNMDLKKICAQVGVEITLAEEQPVLQPIS